MCDEICMEENAIRKIIRLRFRRLRKCYSRMEKAFGMEVIHHFRVEVKKLRAFLRILSAEKGCNKIKIPRQLKDVYKNAGLVRDLQLHIRNIENEGNSSGIPLSHLQQLKRKLAVAKRKLKNVMKPEVLPDAQKKIEKKVAGNLEDLVVENFVQTKTTTILKAISRKTIGDKDLHTVRKYLKDILYIAKIFETELLQPFPFRNWDKEKENYFIGLADELGKFQDSCVSLIHLKEDLQTNVSDEEKGLISSISRKQQRVKRQLKEVIQARCTDKKSF
jgi:CHAD domain-containing protein